MNPNELIMAKELAKRLNVPVSWIYRRTRLGQEAIPHVRMGKYVRFDWEAVVEFYKELEFGKFSNLSSEKSLGSQKQVFDTTKLLSRRELPENTAQRPEKVPNSSKEDLQ